MEARLLALENAITGTINNMEKYDFSGLSEAAIKHR